MDFNNRIYSYKKKLPFYSVPALLITGLLLLMLTIFFGILIGVSILLIASGALLARLFLKPYQSKQTRVEDDGRTIILREDEYKVIDKKN
jgi:MFS superfamily sulfate permease-like transporter